MKANDKVLARRLVEKIRTGAFDENDVSGLFMRLRAHSNGLKVFREIADFVAHSESRDRGVTHGSLEVSFLSWKYYLEYNYSKKGLDISQPVPQWVKHYMLLQADRCEDKDLKKRRGMSVDQLKTRIRKRLVNDTNGNCLASMKDLDPQFVSALQDLTSVLDCSSAYSQDDIVRELFILLRRTDLLRSNTAEVEMRRQGDRIMAAILCLVHRADFTIKPYGTVTCQIGTLEGELPKLDIMGHIPHPLLRMEFPVIQTNLVLSQWITESLLTDGTDAGVLDFDCDIGLNSDFRLVRL